MKIAVLADIHSNHYAFEACVAEAERLGADAFALLGDYVSDCPFPQKTMTLLRQIESVLPVWKIKGNREEYMIAHADGRADGWRYNSQTGSLLYTYEQLSPEDIDDFRKMPISMEVSCDGLPPFEICHGAPWQTRFMLRPDTEESERVMSAMRTELLLCGHTHEQYIYSHAGKTIVNCGPVGIPTGGNIDACFAMIRWDGGRWCPQLLRVPWLRICRMVMIMHRIV